MKKILGIGSCRCLTPLYYLNNENMIIYNSLSNWYIKPTFLGKLHNTKQIIQFIKFIKKEIELPNDVLELFLTTYSSFINPCFARHNNPHEIVDTIHNEINNIEYVFIEVCSIKIFKYNNHHVSIEHIKHPDNGINKNNIEYELQTKEDLINDLEEIIQLLPNKKIIFITHFNFDDIPNRQIINEALTFITNKYNLQIFRPYEDLDIKNILRHMDNEHYSNKGLLMVAHKFLKFIN